MTQVLAPPDQETARSDQAAPQPASPLRNPRFDALLLAAVTTNLGTIMQGVATTWLLLSVTSSAILIALHQTAAAAPMFLLILVAGALADVVDRRLLLLLPLLLMVCVALALAFVSYFGLITPASVLVLVFLLGVGAAFNMPAAASTTPEVVDREQLPPALSLMGGIISVAAAGGPLLAGLLIGAGGPVSVFLAEVALFATAIVIWARWRSGRPAPHLPAEHLAQAVRLGLRYSWYSGPFRGLMIRTSMLALAGSSAVALFPLVARESLSVGPGALGGLFAFMGTGSTVGALAFPSLRKKFGSDVTVVGATVISALGLVGLGTASSFPVFAVALLFVGAAQSTMTTGIISAAQAALPNWVRGRGLSIYMLHFFAATAIGSIIWGLLANGVQLSVALFVAAGAMLGTLLLAPAYRLGAAEALDPMAVNMGAFGFVRAGGGSGEPEFNDGPVGVLVTYTVDDADSETFVGAMAEVGRQRRRDGAMQWRLYRDIDSPGQYIEWFTVATWAEHLRQVERPTASDLGSWTSIQALYRSTRVQHFVAANARLTARNVSPP
jgi:MFS family permease